MKLQLSQVAALTGGTLIGKDATFDGLEVDSREIKAGELFCAVKGEHDDGHNFVASAMTNGAAGAIVQHNPSAMAPVIVVRSVAGAMAAIALHFRRMLKGPVIGVTGSAGKTTVKEMIAAALLSLGDVLKSEGNLNTEFGVPMTWSRLQPHHKSAVIEMAMRGPGQIAHLARMSAPDIGVITSVGSAHIGELGSRDAIAAAKAELLESLPVGGVAIIPADSEFTDLLRERATCTVTTVGYGGDYEVLEWRQSGDLVEFAVRTPDGDVAGSVPGIGEVQARNAAMAIAAAGAVHVRAQEAATALRHVVFPSKRMEIIDRGGVTIWLDAYNSSPESCRLALFAFKDHVGRGRKIAILGDMLELGEFAEAAHRKIGAIAATVGLAELALVGILAKYIDEGAQDAGFVGTISHFEDAESARAVIDRALPGDAILIKASRGIALEKALG
ncbi:MAG: UDP-N-acetylmuramoyl-tripeptide--D-alanyl-D-alanine ligase [Armatimonadota bacterium]|nr:UDP-N-acetylmuramoyl-tripeptide--D-alanyl-D-alanine ligase [Armatimonadota bacterium]